MTYKTQTNSRSSSASSIAAAQINDEADEQRRKFLGMVGGAALLSTTSLPALAGDEEREQLAAPAGEGPASGDEAFRERAFKLRVAAAQANRDAPVLPHPTNGDEERYQNYIGSDTRGLPHDGRGEVDPAAFKASLKAYASGDPAQFEAIPLGGTRKQLNPIGILAVSLEGLNPTQFSIPRRRRSTARCARRRSMTISRSTTWRVSTGPMSSPA